MNCKIFTKRILIALCLQSIVLSACFAAALESTKQCESSVMLVDANFEGGNFAQCSFEGNDVVSILIAPEDAPPINKSPWYSFRLSPKQETNIQIRLSFVDGYARYWPKLSNDGETWSRLDEDQVEISTSGGDMTISLQQIGETTWISAQELFLAQDYEQWLSRLSLHPELISQTIGYSVLGRPIQALMTEDRPEVVFLFGRQHPPEVTGALAMQSFVDTVFSDSELAVSFRKRFSITIIPLLNPDGVAAGHWRHNINGIDLNRDWGPFTQPETQSVEQILLGLQGKNIQPKLMLDFHSTSKSLFYTQVAGELEGEQDFATVWLDRARARLPDFDFLHDPRTPSGQDNTKNYFFSRYNIPAITYEIGDEVDREKIKNSSPVFAEEMMRTMLER